MNKIFIILTCTFALAACWNEPTPEPSTDGDNMQYTLPQGDHDYDTRIVDIFERTGSAMIYKFDKADIFYTGGVPLLETVLVPRPGYENDPDPLKRDSVASPALTTAMLTSMADENYIGKQLDVIEELCFDFYTDEQLSKLLPPTIYLVGEWAQVDKVTYQTLRSAPLITRVTCLAGVGNVTFSWADANVDAMTADQRLRFKKNANYVLIKHATDNGTFTRAAEFGAISTYTAAGMGYSATARNTAGILGTTYQTGNNATTPVASEQVVAITATSKPTPQAVDWDSYIAWIVGTTEAQREDPANTQGFLASTKDTSGKIRQKYNIVVRHMLDNYGIDLVAIGNASVE